MDDLLAGNDCVLEAPTAGGKTEAVLFPTLTRVVRESAASVRILYLAPLKALLNDLETRTKKYADLCGLTAFKWHGDVSQTAKIREMRHPPHVLLTTPESLEAILLRKASWREFFAGVSSVIVDEAHNFAAGDRGAQLLALLERLEAGTGQKPQRIALSATIGNPETMCAWLAGCRPAAKRIEVKNSVPKPKDFKIRHYCETESSGPADAATKLNHDLIEELARKRAIVFVRSRRDAEDLAKTIDSGSKSEVRVRTHHSNVSKFYREAAEELIQSASEQGLNAIVSTSTLELGIDIGELDCVVQFGSLASPSSFLQRVGRTGRRDSKRQYFRGFTEVDEDLLLLTATVSLGIEQKSEALQLRQRSFHILAHQVLCLSLQQHGITPDYAWQALRTAYSFSGVRRDEYDHLLGHMVATDYLRSSDGVLVVGEKTEKRFLTANWRALFATFESAPLYDVLEGKNQVGTLDVAFVAGLEVPFIFVLAGKRWAATKIDHEARVVKVKPSAAGGAPKWIAYGGPSIPFETAQRAGELLYGFRPLPDVLGSLARSVLEAMTLSRAEGGWKPGGFEYLAIGGGEVVLRTFAGDLINLTLGRLLERQGLEVQSDFKELALKAGPDDAQAMMELVHSTLKQASTLSATQLETEMVALQPLYRFSKFADMLPDRLHRAALVDQMIDVHGTLRYLTNAVSVSEMRLFRDS